MLRIQELKIIDILRSNNIEPRKECINLKKRLLFYNLLLIFTIYIDIYGNSNNQEHGFYSFSKEKDYIGKKFAIIKRECSLCGLFSNYMVYLGCIHKYLLEGYIPIIDNKSFPNAINGFNMTKNNNWELLFEQPFGYTLESVLKNAKDITYFSCEDCIPRPDEYSMLMNEPRKHFWHDFSNKYLAIKNELVYLANKIMYKLFRKSKNILGALTRGTDYIYKQPSGHPIPPNVSDFINDVKEMDDKFKYDYIFFSTEDEKIRYNFSHSFKERKIKQIKHKSPINYDYIKADYLNSNENIIGNLEFNKIYLLNIIILSKCLDIITARCSGAVGIFILSKGFRNTKIYDLGVYK